MSETAQKYLEKSGESLASSRDDLAKRRFNSCANRAYYTCYQAAVALLLKHNITPAGGKDLRKHGAVQSQVAVLIKRKKVLPANQRDVLSELMGVRITADYFANSVPIRGAKQALKKAEEFVKLISQEVSS